VKNAGPFCEGQIAACEQPSARDVVRAPYGGDPLPARHEFLALHGEGLPGLGHSQQKFLVLRVRQPGGVGAALLRSQVVFRSFLHGPDSQPA